MNFRILRKQCAGCRQTEYEKCKNCQTYVTLNTQCGFCSDIGGVVPFVKSTANGLVRLEVCPRCLDKLV